MKVEQINTMIDCAVGAHTQVYVPSRAVPAIRC